MRRPSQGQTHESQSYADSRPFDSCVCLSPSHSTAGTPPPLLTKTLVSAQKDTPPLRRCATCEAYSTCANRCQAVFTPAQAQSIYIPVGTKPKLNPAFRAVARHPDDTDGSTTPTITPRARRPLIGRPSKLAGLDGMTCFSSPSSSPYFGSLANVKSIINPFTRTRRGFYSALSTHFLPVSA
jgi:hypothetical protein